MDDDEKENLDRAVQAKNERDQQLADIAEILSLPSGKRFFYRLFEEGFLFTTTFTGNSQGMFYEGRRALALKFFADLCEVDATALAALLLLKAEKIKEGEDNG